MKVAIVFVLVASALVCNAFHPHWERQFHLSAELSRRVDRLGLRQEALPPQYFEQRVDHFNPTSHATFKNLYFVNEAYYSPGSRCAIIYFNGEAPLNPVVIQSGELTVIAQQHSCIVFSLENRFFGSWPTANMSVENLGLHTVEQFLADAAAFQSAMTQKYNLGDAIWMVVGGSYSGATSAYYREKYPSLVQMSYSSSGVVLALDDYVGYDQTQAHNVGLEMFSGCKKALQNATAQIVNYMKTAAGVDYLKKLFNVCEIGPIGSHSFSEFSMYISGVVQGAGQYGYLQQVCPSFAKASNPLEVWADFINQGGACVSTSWIEQTKEISNNPDSYRSWLWLKCTNFGFFKTTQLAEGIFPEVTLDYFHYACGQVFGEQYSVPNTEWNNLQFGAKKMDGTRTIYITGSSDPWTARPNGLGITRPLGPSLPAYYMNGTYHCEDLMPAEPTDNQSLRDTRKTIEKTLSAWLASLM